MKQKVKMLVRFNTLEHPVFKKLEVKSAMLGLDRVNYVEYKGRCYTLYMENVKGHGNTLALDQDITNCSLNRC